MRLTSSNSIARTRYLRNSACQRCSHSTVSKKLWSRLSNSYNTCHHSSHLTCPLHRRQWSNVSSSFRIWKAGGSVGKGRRRASLSLTKVDRFVKLGWKHLSVGNRFQVRNQQY